MAAIDRLRAALDRARGAFASPRRRRAAAGVAVALVVAVALWLERRPTLRVVNASAEPLLLKVDGRLRARLAPTTTETPGAGVEMRLSPGFHRLLVLHRDGSVVEEHDAYLSPHTSYLFAPGPIDQCFWVEHTAYGLATPRLAPLRRLPPDERLWSVPDEIDAWFFPTPPPSGDRRSSGGTRTAIRQARCGFDPWK